MFGLRFVRRESPLPGGQVMAVASGDMRTPSRE